MEGVGIPEGNTRVGDGESERVESRSETEAVGPAEIAKKAVEGGVESGVKTEVKTEKVRIEPETGAVDASSGKGSEGVGGVSQGHDPSEL